MTTQVERIEGGFWGLLIGDALGVPYEFHSTDQIPSYELIEMVPPAGFQRAHASVPPGTWSDDGAQALCLLESLLTCGKLDLHDFASRLLDWYEHGRWAVDQKVFDVGIQTGEALIAFKRGKSPFDTGMVRPDGKGNGALMRVLPLALWHQGSDASLIEDAHTQSRVTHGHPCNQVCCALYCIWARRMLTGLSSEEAYLNAVATLRDLYPSNSVYLQELEWSIRPEERIPSQGTGYVLDGLRCAREMLEHQSYEQVVKSAIALGDDTDTNAAIAGGLAGIRDGLKGIPERWMNTLRGKEMASPLLERLLEWVG